MEFKNEFEKYLANIPFTPDWWERRCYVVSLFIKYSGNESNIKIYTSLDGNIMASFCRIFDDYYMLLETKEDGKVESSQLERIINDYISKVLYSNIENSPSGFAIIYKLIEDGILKQSEF